MSLQLPVDLESGCGMPLRVRVDTDGLHLSRDALDRCGRGCRVVRGRGCREEGGVSRGRGSQLMAFFSTICFSGAVFVSHINTCMNLYEPV